MPIQFWPHLYNTQLQSENFNQQTFQTQNILLIFQVIFSLSPPQNFQELADREEHVNSTGDQHNTITLHVTAPLLFCDLPQNLTPIQVHISQDNHKKLQPNTHAMALKTFNLKHVDISYLSLTKFIYRCKLVYFCADFTYF